MDNFIFYFKNNVFEKFKLFLYKFIEKFNFNNYRKNNFSNLFSSNLKGFSLVGFLIICLIVTFSFAYVNIPDDLKLIQTMSIPVTNKVIVIDAGHGLPDKGAENENGISEEKINLDIALKLQNILESSGAVAILTRSDENAIYEIDSKTISQKKVSDIKKRVQIGNDSSADLFVSIHLNKFSDGKYYGWQTFYKGGDENSKKLAEAIQKNLNDTISSDNKRVVHTLNDIYIMKHVEIPIALVECGFLSNDIEAKNLQDDGYQFKLAWGIFDGIMDYFAS